VGSKFSLWNKNHDYKEMTKKLSIGGTNPIYMGNNNLYNKEQNHNGAKVIAI
jgi:hypothetical protein